ncbi:hypothetical protein ACEXOS_008145 [Herbiconiux sp. P16]|uniref:hypothetical protein n=1 Tax=Herbiconiux wuyangfengii TaxID=3342794 RepID=UPI0035B98FA0
MEIVTEPLSHSAAEVDRPSPEPVVPGDLVASLDDKALLTFGASFERIARAVGGVQTRVAGERRGA